MVPRILGPVAALAAACVVLGGPAAAQDKKAEPIVLPDLQSDAGVLIRLLLVESRNPGHTGYDEAKALAGMKAMKAVVDNRLNHIPAKYKLSDFAAAGAATYRDIVTAPNQFAGFSKDTAGKVVIAAALQRNLTDILDKANTGAPGAYHRFCKNALATVAAAPADPFTGLAMIGTKPVTGRGYGWRTAGAADPGGSFVRIPDDKGGLILGNRFYTLEKRD